MFCRRGAKGADLHQDSEGFNNNVKKADVAAKSANIEEQNQEYLRNKSIGWTENRMKTYNIKSKY